MRLRVLIFTFLFPVLSYGQGKPYAIWENQSTSTYWFVSLDAATGIKTNINPVPGISAFVGGSATAFDTDSSHYIFRALSNSTYRLYTLDAASGTVLYNPLLAGNIVGLNYNCNNKRFYGMRVNGNVYDLVSVNPVTGTDVLIAPMTGILAYVGESFSFSPHTQQFNLVVLTGGGYYLRSYDVATGNLVHSNPFPDNVVAHRYSCADSSLYGLWENAGLYKFERINVSTGTHTTVNVLASVTPGFVPESACINMNGFYIYRGFDGMNNFSLISIQASSGSVVNIATTSDNAVGFEEGMCCYDSSMTSSLNELNLENFTVYPNPVHSGEILLVGRILENVSLSVFNSIGKQVRPDVLIRENQYKFDPFGLPAGLYLLKLTNREGVVVSRNIIIE